MADELDPILEARLRGVLLEEAASIPFTLRADTVRRVQAERRRARNIQRLTLMSAAAVVVVAVAGVVVSLGLRNSSNVATSPSPAATTAPSATPRASSSVGPDTSGLISLSDLQGYVAEQGAKESLRASATAPKGAPVPVTAGYLSASREVIVALSCTGGSVKIDVMAGTETVVSTSSDCGAGKGLTGPFSFILDGTERGTGDGPGGDGTLVLTPDPGVQWRVVAGTRDIAPQPSPSGPPSSNTPAGLPSDEILFRFAKSGSVQVDRAAGESGTFTMNGVAHRVSPALVWACTGTGAFDISLVDDNGGTSQLATSDTGGGCDGSPTLVEWPIWHDPVNASSLKITAADGVAWVAMLVDESRRPSDETASPLPSGELPAMGELQGGRAGFGDKIASDQAPANDSPVSQFFGDVRAEPAVGVLITCMGAGASLGIANETNATVPLGDAVCDGTIQAFTWDRPNPGADGSKIEVDTKPGTTWRAVAFDNSRSLATTSHTTPAVACGKPNLSVKSPPAAVLYQDSKAVGAVSYYTDAWVSGSTDGIPVTPADALPITASPLTLRIAGDVCATGWTVIYGRPVTDGAVGIDPIGLLAIQSTDKANRENRIDLGSLPSGDYVLNVHVTFANGSGDGLIRVRVP